MIGFIEIVVTLIFTALEWWQCPYGITECKCTLRRRRLANRRVRRFEAFSGFV